MNIGTARWMQKNCTHDSTIVPGKLFARVDEGYKRRVAVGVITRSAPTNINSLSGTKRCAFLWDCIQNSLSNIEHKGDKIWRLDNNWKFEGNSLLFLDFSFGTFLNFLTTLRAIPHQNSQVRFWGSPALEAKSCCHSEVEMYKWSKLLKAMVQSPLKSPRSFRVFNTWIWILSYFRDSYSLISDI